MNWSPSWSGWRSEAAEQGEEPDGRAQRERAPLFSSPGVTPRVMPEVVPPAARLLPPVAIRAAGLPARLRHGGRPSGGRSAVPGVPCGLGRAGWLLPELFNTDDQARIASRPPSARLLPRGSGSCHPGLQVPWHPAARVHLRLRAGGGDRGAGMAATAHNPRPPPLGASPAERLRPGAGALSRSRHPAIAPSR